MKLVYSEEHEAYRTSVRRFVEKVLRPLKAQFDTTKPMTKADVDSIFEKLRRHEIATTLPVGEDESRDWIAWGIYMEEIWAVDAAFANLAIAGVLFSPPDLGVPLSEQQRLAYGHLFQPGRFICLGLTEANVGSSPALLETTARRDGDEWIINGRKLWITNGTIADAIAVVARIPEEDGAIGMFLVDRAAQAYEARAIPILGLDWAPPAEVFFDNVRIPAIARLTNGSGLRTAIGQVEYARILVAVGMVGLAREAFEIALQYAQVRKQFGRVIGSFQLVQEMLADMATDIELGRLLAYKALSHLQEGLAATREISMAKYWNTEMAQRVTSKAIQVHGAMGLSKELGVERLYRDARIFAIPDGTTQINKLIVGRELTGISAFVPQ